MRPYPGPRTPPRPFAWVQDEATRAALRAELAREGAVRALAAFPRPPEMAAVGEWLYARALVRTWDAWEEVQRTGHVTLR